MRLFSVGTLDLQSGFVVAVIVLAVFFAERLGGSGQLAQRAYQVALGLVILVLVFSATTAFVRAPKLPEELEGSALEDIIISGGIDDGSSRDNQEREALVEDFSRETAQNASEVSTIHLGLGVLLIAGGLAALSRYRVLPFGLVVGGILLLLFGAGQSAQVSSLSLTGLLYGTGETLAGPGQLHDAIQFAVLFVGTALLLAFGYARWESGEQGSGQPAVPSAAEESQALGA